MKTLAELANLKGRVALITGGAGHLGSAMAEALGENGATVCLLDLNEDRCRSRVSELESGGASAFYVAADLSDAEGTRAAVREAAARHGRLDIIIHAASLVGTDKVTGWAVPFESQSLEAWQMAMRVGLDPAFTLLQEARPFLEASGHGSVIFVSSIYGLVAPDNSLYEGTQMQTPSAYSAVKGALNQLTRHFAALLAPKVRVNALTPGGIWRGQSESFIERYERRTPMRRMGREEDFKGAAAFLASDLSAYVTGHNLVVDGGWTAW
jgi:NAD(P)-dependent dehydrogenase (short-subunit alcohol dehydrogenase family)